MKNLTVLETRDDVMKYVRSLWRTPQFRESAYIDAWVERIARFRAGEVPLAKHVDWLQSFGEVPFPEQARLFAPLYWNNKLSYRLKHTP